MTNTKTESVQSVPRSDEAEQSILGCVLINPQTYYDVSGFLSAGDFYVPRNRWIWEAFTTLEQSKISIDLITVCDELTRHNQLEQTGGAEYITKLIDDVPTSQHAEAYGRMVQKQAVRRRLIDTTSALAKMAYDDELLTSDLVGQAEAEMVKFSTTLSLGNGPRPASEIADEWWEYLKLLGANPESFKGVSTGLLDLDKLLGGLRAPALITIAGRPGAGKTSVMLTIAKNAAQRQKKKIGFFTLEMSSQEIIERLAAMLSNVNSDFIHRGAIAGDEWGNLEAAKNKIHELGIYIDDTPDLTPAQLKSKVIRLKLEYGLDLVIVDYVQLMRGNGKRYDNRVAEVSSITRDLKSMVKALGLPVLVGAQLSRAVEQRQNKRPILSDLRESGSIEQDSDVSTLASTDSVGLGQLIRQS